MLITKTLRHLHLLLTCLVCLLVLGNAQTGLTAERTSVLVLFSYDPELSWSSEILAGIRTGLEPKKYNIDLRLEYMDSKRFHSPAYYSLLRDLYRQKYRQNPPDLVIATDNNALDFVRSFKQDLFGNVPIVFCGVNSFTESMLAGLKDVTGIVEAISFQQTVELAMALHPNVSKFVVFGVDSRSYKLNKKNLESVFDQLGIRDKVRFIENLTISEIEQAAAKLDKDSVILLASTLSGDDGLALSFEQSAGRLTRAANVPVYSFWQFYVNAGAVGGKVASGFSQGLHAALMGRRILGGEAAETIPIIRKSPNPYAFNYSQLKRFGISEKALPPDSIILKRPATLLETNPSLVWAGGSGAVLLILASSLLFFDSLRRRNMAKRLRAGRDFLQNIINGVSDPIMVIDEHHKVIDSNQAAKEQIIGNCLEKKTCYQVTYDFDSPCDQHGMECSLARIKATGETIRLQQEFLTTGNSPVMFDVCVSPIYNEDGSLSCIIKSMRDISELTAARTALTSERNRLAVTLNSIGDGVIACDREGRITLLNPVAEQLTGWRRKEAVGLKVNEIFPLLDAESRQTLPDPIAAVIADDTHIELSDTALFIDRNGGEHNIANSADPIRLESGKLIGAVLVFRDVTEKKRFEQELARSQQLESLGLLAGGIAHDFNNLLMGIRGNIELVRTSRDIDEKAKPFLLQAERACKRAGDLTLQLLTFAKGGRPKKERLHIKDLLEDWVSFTLRGTTSRYELEIEEDLPDIYADRGQLRQVISNLIINANQAMPEGGLLTLRARKEHIEDQGNEGALAPGDYVCIEVEDNGPGIAIDDIMRVFTPYYTTKTQGNGLGLAISYSIASKHDGNLTVKNRPEGGAIFSLFLPLSETAVIGAHPEKKPALKKSQPLSILVMDDEEIVCTVVKEMLHQCGHTAIAVNNGHDAVHVFKQQIDQNKPFSGVFLDLTVPGGMGGVETLTHLKNIAPDIKAIASSGYAEDAVMTAPKAHGFVAAISKPFTLEELHMVLELFQSNFSESACAKRSLT